MSEMNDEPLAAECIHHLPSGQPCHWSTPTGPGLVDRIMAHVDTVHWPSQNSRELPQSELMLTLPDGPDPSGDYIEHEPA